MVVYDAMADALTDDDVDRLFHALADATRRDILSRTMRADQSITALSRGYDMSFAAVQKHVTVLADAGLVSKERRGRERLVRAVPARVRRARELLSRYESLWRERAAGIEAILAADDSVRGTARST
ncbi:ArsR/SmtB family transcription factor [Humibacter albus]|uniref:ArsR/SmtB family transcription factor n=1 Tax=Humibacter albus TaxID=427754 RepID=UPI0003B2F819|nr:helix-turn-helix domain-containing protein [Humibacter albus]